jgi:hypothetical protein
MRFLLFLITLLVMVMPIVAAAVPPQPSFGTAVVDGHYGEWNLTADFFADMYRAGGPDKIVESKLYLRYDCITNTMYVLVLVQPGVVGYIDSLATTAWVAINTNSNKVVNELSGNDGIPPDFAWIDRGYDGDNWHVRGFEASFYIVPGTYNILASLHVLDGGIQTSATDIDFPHTGPELVIPDWPSAVGPSTFGAIKALYR